MSVLIAGGSGMLGLALQKHFAKTKTAFRAVSKRGVGGCEAFDVAEAADVKKLFEKRYDYVIHAAAMSDVDGCERDPERAHANNALTAKRLAEACAAHGVPLIYVSTDYVFDGRKRAPYETGDATGPINVYGMTKLEGEHFSRLCPRSAVVRTSWLFGPGNPSNFVDAIRRRLEAEPSVSVLYDQKDAPTYTSDLAAALEKIGAHLRGGKAGKSALTFHFCNKGETTRFEMTEKIKDVLGLKRVRVEKAEAIPNRPALRPAYAVMSTREYEKFFGTEVRGWEEGLREYLCAS